MMTNTFTNPAVPLTVPVSNGNGFGVGNNEFIWIFALLILFGGGFGGGFGARGEQAIDNFELGKLTGSVATKDSVQMLTNQLSTEVAGVNANIFNVREQLGNGLSALGFEFSSRLSDLATQIASCCCEIRTMLVQGFGEVKYDMANFSAQINANQTAGTQKILDAIAQDKAERQAERIHALELKEALCGVVRYPNQWTYNAGPAPFCQPSCM